MVVLCSRRIGLVLQLSGRVSITARRGSRQREPRSLFECMAMLTLTEDETATLGILSPPDNTPRLVSRRLAVFGQLSLPTDGFLTALNTRSWNRRLYYVMAVVPIPSTLFIACQNVIYSPIPRLSDSKDAF